MDASESVCAVMEVVSTLKVSSEVALVLTMMPVVVSTALRSSAISSAWSRTIDVREATADWILMSWVVKTSGIAIRGSFGEAWGVVFSKAVSSRCLFASPAPGWGVIGMCVGVAQGAWCLSLVPSIVPSACVECGLLN